MDYRRIDGLAMGIVKILHNPTDYVAILNVLPRYLK
jgi:hypothetical protein